MRKAFRWIAIAAASPFVVFLLLASLVALPPVQGFLLDKATDALRQETGLDVHIDKISLGLPFDITLHEVYADRNDTLVLDASSFRVRVKFFPLFKKRIDIDGIELFHTRLNTLNLISDVQLRGSIGSLYIDAHDIDIARQHANIGQAVIEQSDIQVLLSDTAKKDTTPSQSHWTIDARKVRIADTHVFVRMPNNAMQIAADLQKAEMAGGHFDTGRDTYKVGCLTIAARSASYDIPSAPAARGEFDANHIALNMIQARLDSTAFAHGAFSTRLERLAFTEESGANISNLTGRVTADSTRLAVTGLKLNTPHSALTAAVSMDWDAIGAKRSGSMRVRIQGKIDKRDLLPFVSRNVAATINQIPHKPIMADITASGNLSELHIANSRLHMPGVFAMNVAGTLRNPNENRRSGNLSLGMRTGNLDFIKPLAGITDNSVNIPRGIRANAQLAFSGSNYSIGSHIGVGRGLLALNGSYSTSSQAYRADLHTKAFPINKFLPALGIGGITATAKINGQGFDIFSRNTRIGIDAQVGQLAYNKYDISRVCLKGNMRRGTGAFQFLSDNSLLRGSGNLTLSLAHHQLQAALNGDIANLNVGRFMQGGDTLAVAARVNIKAHTDKKMRNYGASGNIAQISILTPDSTYRARGIDFGFINRRDTLWANIGSGDLRAYLGARGDVNKLATHMSRFIATAQSQINRGEINRLALRKQLPDMGLLIKAGSDNPAAYYLKHYLDYEFRNLDVWLKSSPAHGLEGEGKLTGFNTGAILLDSTHLSLHEDTTGLRLDGIVLNNSKKNRYKFEASVNGCLSDDKASIGAIYKDAQGNEGINVGLEATMHPDGINLHLYPHNPVIAFRHFTVNTDNHIYLKRTNDISANVNLLADDGTGLKIYSVGDDSIPDITLSVSQLNLGELANAIPYMPNISGKLNGDVQAQRDNGIISAVADLHVKDMAYDGSQLGDIGLELSYMPDSTLKEHFVDAIISRSDTSVAQVNGKYIDRDGGLLDMNVSLNQFPLNMLNGFTGGTIAFNGFANGTLALTGRTERPAINGNVHLDSTNICSNTYGINLRLDSTSLKIADNLINLNDINLYSTGKNPLTLNGSIDFKQLDNIKLALGLRAKEFEIVNAKKTDESEVYGHIFADCQAWINGTPNNLKLRGMLTILGNSEIGYVLKDSPLTVDDRLSDLVTFVNFSDSTSVEEKPMAEISGIDMTIGISIEGGTRLHCDLSSDGQSYLDIEGGGDLSLGYNRDGTTTLTGRYTANSGEMKYALSVIPLRTFKILNGSHVDFTGDPMNPTLDIQARERVRASVNEDNNPRSVAFDVGVDISKTLSDMGLEFTIDAPEDGTVKNQLAAMSREQRSKMAVSMLVTGMYLAENNQTSGFSANNALNAFLQSEIQNIAGNAMKSIDLNLSVDNGTTASGASSTDYSFRFAKRFWGNRVSIIIGGRVSTGAEAQNDAQSFIDNVSIEYRLDKTASRYVRLYYNNDSDDPLEGRLTELGGGIVLRKKASSIGDLFVWKKKKKQ